MSTVVTTPDTRPVEANCVHCGTRFIVTGNEGRFCCGGCRYVHNFIHSEGLDHFYDLKDNRTIDAVGDKVFNPVDWTWAKELQNRAESGEERAHAEVHLSGMSCAACAWLIERRFLQSPGALRIDVFPEEARLRLFWESGAFSLSDFLEDLLRFGYRASETEVTESKASRLGPRLGLCGGFALNTMAFTLPRYLGLEAGSDLAALFDLIALASATLSVLVGGGYFFKRAWLALQDRMLHIDFPIALGIAVAYLASIGSIFSGESQLFYVDFVATFVFLMLLGRWMQERALASARQRHLGEKLVRDEFQALCEGDAFELKAGEVVPVESVLESDSALVSLEWINGEPDPLTKATGQVVPAGSRLLSRQPAKFQAREAFEGGLLSQLMGQRGATSDALLQRVLRIYLLVVLAVALLGAGVWLWVGGGSMSLQVFVSVLVVSCPCALGVAIPLINARASRQLEREGLFVRDLSLWNRLRKVTQLAFDKTGTLTLPVPRLLNENALQPLSDQERAVLHQLVDENRHPLARSLHEALGFQAVETKQGEVVEEPGNGVWLKDDEGHVWTLGKPGWRCPELEGHLVFCREGVLLASFSFEEALRPGAESEMEQLHRRFGRLAILSGDQSERVQSVARQVGIDPELVHGRLTPGQKADWLRDHHADQTLFIGDGANDSLAFDLALCSGTPANGAAIIEGKADFFFLGKGLHALSELLKTAEVRQSILLRVFFFAVLYNLGAIVLCLGGWMNPLLAAVLMPLSSLAILGLATWGWKR